MEIRQVLRAELVMDAFRRSPQSIINRVDPVLAMWAQRIAAAARVNAGRNAAFSNLVNSIGAHKVAELHHQVRAGAAHARPVEEGTGPAVGHKPYMPNPAHLMAWVKLRAGIRWRGRPGSATRRAQIDEVRDRAWALAAHIRRHGTRPHPFMRPAVERHEQDVRDAIAAAAVQGAREAFS